MSSHVFLHKKIYSLYIGDFNLIILWIHVIHETLSLTILWLFWLCLNAIKFMWSFIQDIELWKNNARTVSTLP